MHTKSHDTKDPMCDNPREIGEEALNKFFFFFFFFGRPQYSTFRY